MTLGDFAMPARVAAFAALVGIAAYNGEVVGAIIAVLVYVAGELLAYRHRVRDARQIEDLENDIREATRPLTPGEEMRADEMAMMRQTRIRTARDRGDHFF